VTTPSQQAEPSSHRQPGSPHSITRQEYAVMAVFLALSLAASLAAPMGFAGLAR
jgi:hypothetical protein